MKKEPWLRSAANRQGNRAMKVYSVLLTIVFSLPTSILAQVQFTPHTVRWVPDPRSVFAIDVDGDGDMDLLSASGGGGLPGGNEIAWYENDGIENFTFRLIATSAEGGESVFAIDVDGDGDIDVLSASVFDNKIAWYENDGNEFFTAHDITSYPNLAWAARSVYAVDVDGDGDIDVLSASEGDDKVAWYENDGNENFSEYAITTSADGVWSVYAADVDGDGDMDVLSASNYDDTVAWYENDGSENFTPHTITASAVWANSVYATDVDGDGDMDVLSASFGNGEIAWYENDGNESFAPHIISVGEIIAFWVYAVDVDGDGDIDVVSNGVVWYENDGNENFTANTIGDVARSVYVVDVDGDGDMDVVSDKIDWFENLGSPTSVEIVDIDIKPGNKKNKVNPKSRGRVKVAVLGSEDFDALQVKLPTVRFGPDGTKAIRWRTQVCDVNHDHYPDLVLKFKTRKTGIECGDTEAELTGETYLGEEFAGTDSIRTVRCH